MDFYAFSLKRLTLFILLIGFITRIFLLFSSQTQIGFSFFQWIEIFLVGAFNDLCFAGICFFAYWLYFIVLSDKKYQKPWGYIIEGVLILALLYVSLFNTVFDEYGSVVPKIVKIVLLLKLITFSIRLFVPSIRHSWSRAVYILITFLFVSLLLINVAAEINFWNEFGVRYNFIAVDYLVYTNEVIGNIMESYPIVPMFIGLALLAGIITYFWVKPVFKSFTEFPSGLKKVRFTLSYAILAVFSIYFLGFNQRFQTTGNVYVNELQANGAYKFYNAFKTNELKYHDFYVTLPEDKAVQIINEEYHSYGKNNVQEIKDSLPEIHKNIVLITVESLSASYLGRYGDKQNLTPNLNKLIDESLSFDNLFACGNRTVRGLEAVSLCLPPSPGESVIKKPNNANLFSVGKILLEKGYTVQFLYGGFGYFDNMSTFFKGNGYEIVDRSNFSPNEITFANIWGVCDEDMYRKAIQQFSRNAQNGKPFFGHIMTVSNHRPFTYPDGKIDISPKIKSRKGGVKYTDYAMGKFFEMASKQSWFKNTIFIITADHCASSAGKTEIPLEGYHIPCFIYAPDFVKPAKLDVLMSQTDIMPTVFGLLHFSYTSQFYGKNALSLDFKPRAFAATYQNLGYYEGNTLTVLSPVRKVEQFQVNKTNDFNYKLTPMNLKDKNQEEKAIANYQTASTLLENRNK